MKKLISVLLLTPAISCASFPMDIHVMAKSYPYTVNRNIVSQTMGDYWIEAINYSDREQKISIVTRHCTQADIPVCETGEYVHVVAPHETWKQQFRLYQNRLYAYGQYSIGDEIDVRVDSTYKHYYSRSHDYIIAS